MGFVVSNVQYPIEFLEKRPNRAAKRVLKCLKLVRFFYDIDAHAEDGCFGTY